MIFFHERQMAKDLIKRHIEQDETLEAAKIEEEIRRITGYNDVEHRCLLEEYIQSEIDKLNIKDGGKTI